MDEVLDDILNELEFITGDTDSSYGALRAAYGHPEPYVLNYVEVGNEDWLSETYPYRWNYLFSGLKAAYPDLTVMSNAFNENKDYNITLAPGTMWDTHHYEDASYFLDGFNFYDNWQESTNNTNVTVSIGEYSMYQVDTSSGFINFSRPIGVHTFYPTLEAAISEGVYLLGAERNPAVVKMSAYAPSFANINYQEWTPNPVTFQADWDLTVLSASYYMQQLFARYRGAETLPTRTVSGDFNPLWWVATIESGDAAVYFKVINTGNSSIPLKLDFDQAWSRVNGTMITSPNLQDFNYVNNATAVSPSQITTLPGSTLGESTFTWSVPPWSINVLEFSMGGTGWTSWQS